MFLAPVAAPGGKPGNAPPPNTKFVEVREWESIEGKNLNFR